jgi:trehalose-phosphatase
MSRVADLVERILGLDRPLLIALDVDGTISPIVRDPHTAEIPDETLATLQGLTGASGVELALVTGRDLDSLRRMERLEGIWRAVEHGGVVLAPGEAPRARSLTERQRAALDRFREWVDADASDAFVEYKPQAIALHVRGIAMRDPERAERLMGEADALAQRLGLHVRRGKALREAEAVQNDKGRALEEILDRSGARSVFFAGDDLTDFSAIELANTRGIGAFVQSREQRGAPSGEAVLLGGVDEVASVLGRLLEGIHG